VVKSSVFYVDKSLGEYYTQVLHSNKLEVRKMSKIQ